MDRDAEKRVGSCHECQIVSQPSAPEPIVRKKCPDGPWEDLAVDLLGPLPSGDSILVVVLLQPVFWDCDSQDDYNSTCSRCTWTHIHNTWLAGDSLLRQRSAVCVKEVQIVHEHKQHPTPLWLQANGEVERQNHMLLKAIRIAHAQGQDLRKELRTFLLAYRSTFCWIERSAQNFRNLILLSKQKLTKRFATSTELKKKTENSALIGKEMQKKQKLL